MRVAVIGCGAVGSLFAAHLAQLEDVEVWAYDLAQEHVDAINENGLRLSGVGDLVGQLRATTDAAELPACDFGIVAVKSMHTDPALAATAHAFADGAVCSVQNGIGNEELIAQHVDRVMRGTTFPAGHVIAPGHVGWDTAGETWIGPFEPKPAAAGRGRAARRGAHALRHDDAGARGRARGAVDEGDLQRFHEPGRRTYRARARRDLRLRADAEVDHRPDRRVQGGR